MKAIRIKATPILLEWKDGGAFAVFNCCPPNGCAFEKKILNAYVVMCPCNGWKFDIHKGQQIENKQTALQTYWCKIEEGKIFVEVRKSK